MAERAGVHPGRCAASGYRSAGAGADVTGPWPGQRVAVDTIVSCGTCYWCQRGEVTRCPALGALGLHGDGGLAELCNAPARICLPVPDTVADDEAALAEPLAVAVRALRRGGPPPRGRGRGGGGGGGGRCGRGRRWARVTWPSSSPCRSGGPSPSVSVPAGRCHPARPGR